VVVFGEGAGANILARFAMQHESRVYGAFLIHLVGTTESVFSKANFRMSLGSKGNALKGWNPAIEEFLVKHRFGKFKDSAQSSMKEYTEAYKTFLNTLNNKNCMDYISAYSSRNSIKEKIGELQCPVIFITCNKSVYNNSVVELHYTMQRCFDKDPTRKLKTELIQFDGIGNVLVEKPSKVAECFQYFLQGLGLGSSLINRRISSTSSSQSNPPPKDPRIRSLSMADYDKPRGLTYYSGSAAQPDTPERKQPD
jgi:protein NDRG1